MNGNYGWLRNYSKKQKVHFFRKICKQTQRIHTDGSPKGRRKKPQIILKVIVNIRKKLSI